jgi:hypothetical protein
MKKRWIALIIVSLLALICIAANTVGIVGEQVRPFCFEGKLYDSSIISTSDSLRTTSWAHLKFDVAGMDSAKVVVEGRVSGGAWGVVGDTIAANGQYDRSTSLPLTWMRLRSITKNDPGLKVRLTAKNY